MGKIAGRDLRDVLRGIEGGDEDTRKKFNRHRLLRVFQEVCNAMAYAHAHGVIHRDLKPANVMVGEYGEVFVVDWGLAKVRGEGREKPGGMTRAILRFPGDEPLLTVEGQVMGTPAYMPPEQADGRIAEIDDRSDIYSLGAILYEILTFRPPFTGDTARNVLSKVLSEDVVPPSERVTRRSLRKTGPAGAGPVSMENIPPELDEIVLRALSKEKASRYASCRELSDDIQLYLEGEKERERNHQQAMQKVSEGRTRLEKTEGMRGELGELEKKAREEAKGVKEHWPVDRKKEFWAMEDQVKSLRRRIVEGFTGAGNAFQEALGFERENPEARAGLAELYWGQFLRAEEAGSETEMVHYEGLVRQYNDGQYDARLRGDGTLTLRTLKYGCPCLGPVKAADWRVRIHGEDMLPVAFGSRDFIEEKLCVPRTETVPGDARFGHGPECAPDPVGGAGVRIFRVEEEDRRRIPRWLVWEGKSPVERVSLAMGSYVAEVTQPGCETVRCPVNLCRCEDAETDVILYSREEVPPGMALVPAGRFIEGGEQAGGGRRSVRNIPYDYFVSVHPVTCAEYLAFLGDLAAENPDEARKRVPRESPDSGHYWPYVENTGFVIPTASWLSEAPDDLKEQARRLTNAPKDWEEDWPVYGVSWFDAVAFCEWRSRREGRVYSLPTEEEWEKAARGVDGRIYPFGNHFDATWLNIQVSHESGIRPCSVHDFPTDVSPYGIRGLGGNACDWCLSAPGEWKKEWRGLRGGAWSLDQSIARSGNQWGAQPANVSWVDGFRVVCRTFRPGGSGDLPQAPPDSPAMR
jgi:serine/threonine-protein kinase